MKLHREVLSAREHWGLVYYRNERVIRRRADRQAVVGMIVGLIALAATITFTAWLVTL